MDTFDFAIQQEIEGEQLYRSLAAKAPCTELGETLLLLASEEVKHQKLIESLKKGAPLASLPVNAAIARPESILKAISMAVENADIIFDYEIFFRHSIQLEISSEVFYSQLAQESTNSHQKALFLRLAGEERMHQALLEGILHVLELTKPSTKS